MYFLKDSFFFVFKILFYFSPFFEIWFHYFHFFHFFDFEFGFCSYFFCFWWPCLFLRFVFHFGLGKKGPSQGFLRD